MSILKALDPSNQLAEGVSDTRQAHPLLLGQRHDGLQELLVLGKEFEERFVSILTPAIASFTHTPAFPPAQPGSRTVQRRSSQNAKTGQGGPSKRLRALHRGPFIPSIEGWARRFSWRACA